MSLSGIGLISPSTAGKGMRKEGIQDVEFAIR